MHRTTIFIMQYISIIIRITAVLSFINKKNKKRSNNAEQDNVYDIVNSYNDRETAILGGVKSSNCTQQDNIYDVTSSVLYTANKIKVGLKRSGPAPKQRIAL